MTSRMRANPPAAASATRTWRFGPDGSGGSATTACVEGSSVTGRDRTVGRKRALRSCSAGMLSSAKACARASSATLYISQRTWRSVRQNRSWNARGSVAGGSCAVQRWRSSG